MYQILKRFSDILLSAVLFFALAIPMAVIALIIKLTSPGPAIHWSKRVGINNSFFMMAKFRTMRTDTPQVATHLMTDADSYVTPIGRFLRRYSLDELPQLYNILRGDISFVGPRPALFNQDDLVALRTKKEVHTLVPGLTGWAQVNGRDELPIPVKVGFDTEYLARRGFVFDCRILALTFLQVFKGQGVSH